MTMKCALVLIAESTLYLYSILYFVLLTLPFFKLVIFLCILVYQAFYHLNKNKKIHRVTTVLLCSSRTETTRRH